MIKIILFAVLFFYALYRVGGFLLKILSLGATNSQDSRRPKDGSVHVDSNPKENKKSFEGGEYVDFEEIK